MPFCYKRISPLDAPLYAFGFDSLILNIFSYPPRGCKKTYVFLKPYFFF